MVLVSADGDTLEPWMNLVLHEYETVCHALLGVEREMERSLLNIVSEIISTSQFQDYI